MTVYKLKVAWSSFKAGEKFTASDYDGLYKLVNDDGELVLAKIPTDLLDEVDDGGYWKPKAHERYYFIDDGGAVDSDTFDPDMIYDNDRLLVGNCFRIEKDARAMVAWLKARQRLIESGARFVNYFNATSEDEYYRVVFNRMEDYLQVIEGCLDSIIVQEKELLFSECSLAEQSIKEHKDDWLTYLGVKEKSDDNS